MIRIALFLVLIGFLNCAYSHSPNEVSFSIYEKDTFILVDTEFPWSIRNAVFIADSTLSDSSSFDEIKNSLFHYVNQNFVMTDVKGKQIKLLKLVDLKNKGHHENYQFVFENKEIGKIKNSLLFNFSKKQKNYHVLQIGNERKEFVLSKEDPEVEIKEPSSFSKLQVILLILIILLLGFILRNKFSSQ